MNGLCFKQKNEEKERFYKQIKVQSFLLSSALVLEVDFLFSMCTFFPLLDALNRIFNETKMFVQLKRFFFIGNNLPDGENKTLWFLRLCTKLKSNSIKQRFLHWFRCCYCCCIFTLTSPRCIPTDWKLPRIKWKKTDIFVKAKSDCEHYLNKYLHVKIVCYYSNHITFKCFFRTQEF